MHEQLFFGAIDENGVTLVIAAPVADLLDVNVEVLDNNGDVVATVATDIPGGATAVTFDFVDEYEDDLEGVWTVNGVQYNFDEIALVADIIAAAEGDNQVDLRDALKEAGIVGVDEDLIEKYVTAIVDAKGDLETYADVQEVIDEVNEANDLINDDEVLVALAEADTELAFFNVLNNNFDDVNPLWSKAYETETGVATLDVTEGKLDTPLSAEGVEDALKDVQDDIYAVNLAQIDDLVAKTGEKASELQARKTVLLEEWVEDHGDVKKADLVYDSQVDEAEFKIDEAEDVVQKATTENTLYAALQDYQVAIDGYNALVDGKFAPKTDLKDFTLANKAFYFEVADRDTKTPQAIVTAGNALAKTAAELDAAIADAEAAMADYLAAGGDKEDTLYVAVKNAIEADAPVKATVESTTAALEEVTVAIGEAEEAMADYVAAGGKTYDAEYVAVKNLIEGANPGKAAIDTAVEALELKTTALEDAAEAKADAAAFLADHERVLDLSLVPNDAKEIKADDLADAKAANKAYGELSAAAQTAVDAERVGLATTAELLEGAEGRFLVDVNLIAGEGNMSEKLAGLENPIYAKLPEAQQKEVAKLFIITNDTDSPKDGYTDFAEFSDIETALETAMDAYTVLLDGINNAETIDNMKSELGKVGTYFDITIGDTMANIVLTNMPADGYGSIAEIITVLGL